MVAVNGEYSCPTCEIRGKTVAEGGGHCRIFPLAEDSAIRTDRSIRENAENGTPDQPDIGFYGWPRLKALREFDYESGALLDAMHNCCLGVAKKYVTLLFEGTQRYLTNEERLTAKARYRHFFPPPSFSRNPSDINPTQWKASDYRNWIIHYSVPCLIGLLEPKYLQHWILFVDAYVVLNGTNIQPDDIQRAGNKLKKFASEFDTLFDANEFTMNFHSILHLSGFVNSWGPFYCYDLFAFESMNGWLTRHSHATHNVIRSLMKPLLGMQVLKKQAEKISVPGELQLPRLIQGKRLQDGLSDLNWMSWSGTLPCAFADSNFPPDHPCLQHVLKRVNTASVGGVAVWTDRYRRPRRTLAKYFLLKDIRSLQNIFVRVNDLTSCWDCKNLFIVATQMLRDFLEPNRIQLTDGNMPLVVINARYVELQECVASMTGAKLEVSLVSRSRYSD